MSCSDDLLDYNFAFGDRQQRIRNTIFRNGIDATLLRSVACSGTITETASETQTFARQNYGLNESLIIKTIDTIVLDGIIGLTGETTFWDAEETSVISGTVSLSSADYYDNYEYLGHFDGIEIDFQSEKNNIVDNSFNLISVEIQSESTTLSENSSAGDTELFVQSSSGFFENDYIVIEKNSTNNLMVELLQIEGINGNKITIRTPSVNKNIIYPNGLKNNHVFGSTIHRAVITEKDNITDYTVNLNIGTVSINSNNFNLNDLIFFNYRNEILTQRYINQDYTIDLENGIVTRIESGSIPFGGTVHVDYSFNQRCIDPKSGAPRKSCACNGLGFSSLPPEKIRGLFHIPTYDSMLSLGGYFEMGDALFTVPELSDFHDITASPRGVDGYFIRDMLIVDDKYWLVMTKPQSFNLQNQFLGRKLHIRLIST